MALKGAIAKEEIAAKILEVFPNSFRYEKEIRIPVMENGEMVQIKVALTAAKVAVEQSGAPIGATKDVDPVVLTSESMASLTPTQEEKDNIARLLENLGL